MSMSAEARQAVSERMKQRWEEKRKREQDQAQVSDETKTFNPIATDVVEPTPPRPRGRPKQPKPPVEPTLAPPTNFSASRLVSQLEAIPLSTITHSDCGLLLNALSVASTAVANSRRERQEQMEAGSHTSRCITCDRLIDISKPGGFQILTERDQFHMPINRYYCSQNCLLARNMPSHARQTSREKRENQA